MAPHSSCWPRFRGWAASMAYDAVACDCWWAGGWCPQWLTLRWRGACAANKMEIKSAIKMQFIDSSWQNPPASWWASWAPEVAPWLPRELYWMVGLRRRCDVWTRLRRSYFADWARAADVAAALPAVVAAAVARRRCSWCPVPRSAAAAAAPVTGPARGDSWADARAAYGCCCDAAADDAAGGPGRPPVAAAACPAWGRTPWPRKSSAWAGPCDLAAGAVVGAGHSR